MRKMKTLKPGTIFTYAKEKFVVLEQMGDGAFCLLAQSGRSVPFHNGDDDPRNDYRKASLRKEIEELWLPKLIANGAKSSDMIQFDVDLRPTDQSEGYGLLEGVYAAPLTLWQYGKYKDFIPLNEDDAWWLVTPWATLWLRSPYTSSASNAWYVSTNGNYYDWSAASSCGVRPALKLNSELLVSVDGSEEEDCDCNECDNYTVDLSRVETLALVREVEKRLSEAISVALGEADEE